jgi:hypothetical protein
LTGMVSISFCQYTAGFLNLGMPFHSMARADCQTC